MTTYREEIERILATKAPLMPTSGGKSVLSCLTVTDSDIELLHELLCSYEDALATLRGDARCLNSSA